MADSLTQKEMSELKEEVLRTKQLLEITIRINAARNIKHILIDLKEGILNLFDAHSINIYVIDRNRNVIFSMFLVGTELSEIRVSINNKSIAGFVANTKRIVNIADVSDKKELKSIHPELTFDVSRDRKSGLYTKQILSAPLIHNNVLMGVVQLLNKKGGGDVAFGESDIKQLQEIAQVLALAFFNQERISDRRKTRFEYLIRLDLLKEDDLDSAWDEARQQKETVESYLMRKYKISKADIGRSLGEYFNCSFFEFNEKFPIPSNLLDNLNPEFLRHELWVPLDKSGGVIRVLVDDPNNILKRDSIMHLLKTKMLKFEVALAEDILKFINYFFSIPTGESTFKELLGKMETVDEVDEASDEEVVTESDSSIVQLVNKIINDAYDRRTSDIHIEPNTIKQDIGIRFRVDGECALYQTAPFSYRAAIISRIKIMSNLDITVKRLPQDGKIKFRRPGGDEIELRVATIPTQGGVEDVVMRILPKGEAMPLDAMNMSPRNYKALIDICEKPYGMILVVGPTGSGKTTTLHAALHQINTLGRKIWTAEDPVEITQNGLRQVQVNPKIGFDFAAAMRSFLRADPDVIMVGEMRDFETAKTGVEASLTGHLVFSTLHTNSAPETITRLLDMGIDPLNFADALLGILAQRLVRTLCKSCRESYHPPRSDFDEMAEAYGRDAFAKLGMTYNNEFKLNRPKGCDACDNTGYRGRIGIHELLIGSDQIKRAIQRHASVDELRETAVTDGMTTLLQDGIQKTMQGLTDFTHVRHVCMK
jgi:type II secretory ATPase GspE/PulE/Tfp pilus assembly ATPase PilB-like protein/GAF domain-containing protein